MEIEAALIENELSLVDGSEAKQLNMSRLTDSHSASAASNRRLSTIQGSSSKRVRHLSRLPRDRRHNARRCSSIHAP
jgi:hypothetical protein